MHILSNPRTPRYFFDAEFHEDGATIELISIGIVSSDKRRFYAVNQQAQLDRVSGEQRKNVLPYLPRYGDDAWMTRDAIADSVRVFVAHNTNPIQFWGYGCSYDWVALCQLYGTTMALPSHFPKHCMDLKQAAELLGDVAEPPKNEDVHISLGEALWNAAFFDVIAKEFARRDAATATPR
ncbi:MAG: 3'-5' exoribonuclease domain-containing protein [Polyangiales bacterium]